MQGLRFTLLADGPSDVALIEILNWLLRQKIGSIPIQSAFADLGRLPIPPKGLSERICWSVKLFPCDLLFVHRDAERESIDKRKEEIHKASKGSKIVALPIVCVVPIRMTESWLLVDETALRKAAGNPNGDQPLQMPEVRELEKLVDPKETLHKLLREASGHEGRRLRRFERTLGTSVQRVSELIRDFQPLRGLVAFQRMEKEIERVVKEHGWQCPP